MHHRSLIYMFNNVGTLLVDISKSHAPYILDIYVRECLCTSCGLQFGYAKCLQLLPKSKIYALVNTILRSTVLQDPLYMLVDFIGS